MMFPDQVQLFLKVAAVSRRPIQYLSCDFWGCVFLCSVYVVSSKYGHIKIRGEDL